MLRGVRYTSSLKDFDIEADTEATIAAHASEVEGVAAERVQAEWSYLLAGPQWVRAVDRSLRLGLVPPTLGIPLSLADARSWDAFEKAAVARGQAIDAPLTLRLAALVTAAVADGADAVEGALKERRWPAAIARRACRSASWARLIGRVTVGELAEWALSDHEAARDAALIARALDEGTGLEPSAAKLEDFARRACEERWVRGADLLSWGMQPGPSMGELLHRAARGQVERRWESAEEARSWARHRAERGGASRNA
jgi:tRNA nucleotidyltransferase/poly(A) polymerase